MAKSSQKVEVLEDRNVIVDRFQKTEIFFLKNSKIILYALGAVTLLVVAFVFYKINQGNRNQEAEVELINPVFAWEEDSLKKALKGDGGLGLLDIADEYSGTKAGDLASYYVGVAYMKDGKFDDAIESLKNFSSNDLLLQGKVYCLLGDAYLEQKELETAIEYYTKATEYKPNEYFTPGYLIKLALAYELSKDNESAIKAYDRIINEYPKANEAYEAKKRRALDENIVK
jgi:TolA-binding protein